MNKDELKELAATLNGIADGKNWEYFDTGDSDTWVVGGLWDNPVSFASTGYKIRLKSWQLPQPPDGMQWHRDDWTEEMLPDGYRPLMNGEPRVLGDQFFFTPYEGSPEWVDCSGTPASPNSPSSAWCHHRTKRPIPKPQQPDPYAELKAAYAAGKVIQFKRIGNNEWREAKYPDWTNYDMQYRIKPEQQKVPLGPSDVLPGSVFTSMRSARGYCAPCLVDDDGCFFASRPEKQDRIVRWEAMIDGWWIWRPTDTEWQPCYKLIDTP